MNTLPATVNEHPCLFEAASRQQFVRLHLPVSSACNIKCRYCDRKYNCANESRPGVTSKILTPHEALRLVKEVSSKNPKLRVIGFAGPGDPLADDLALDTLKLIHDQYPYYVKCLSTNGLLLPQYAYQLRAAGVKVITVTVNAVDAPVGEKIYKSINWLGTNLGGRTGAAILWEQQSKGIEMAASLGLYVKINSVLIPGINHHHLNKVASTVSDLGASKMNIIPLHPLAEFSTIRRPSQDETASLRQACSKYIAQMKWCQSCRADAMGSVCGFKEF